MKRFLQAVAVVAVALWVRTAFYAVDYAEFAYVTQFGEKVAILDGETDAGLKLKAPWPVQSVVRIDRRVQSFDLPPVESLTRDPVSKTVDLGKRTSYELRNLDAYIVYSFTVDALNDAGDVIATGGTASQMTTDIKLFLPSARR